ncbi:MAG: transcriptional regulator NrdR, partial [Chloroflexota bacterium]|nr:transcriptional regulator NrdR [Chloroflexota bacterium]
MRCPYCGHNDSKVVDSRSADQEIRRRRECIECKARFTTFERVDNSSLAIVKKDRRREAFDREKLLRGLRKACEKRPLPTGTVEKLADDIEYELQRMGRNEIPGSKVGEIVMDKLLRLDHIAYIRFASVYRDFTDIGSLKKEVDSIAAKHKLESQLPLIS